MNLTKDASKAQYRLQSYSNRLFRISDCNYAHSLILSPDHLEEWQLNCIQDFDLQHVEKLLSFKPKIVIIGTGSKHFWLKSEHLLRFYAQNVGIEVMDTKAACRTYSILSSEGREVLAALLL